MAEAVLFGLVASSALVVGSSLGAFWQPPDWLVGSLLALASGALIGALCFELFPEAERVGGLGRAATALIAGATVFIAVDWALERYLGRSSAGRHEAIGFALFASVTLDGVPENLALGVSLAGESSLALLVGIFASNLPESLAGAQELREGGHSARAAIGLWVLAAVALAAAVVVGRAAFGGAEGATLAVPLAFAGGAVLASLADTIIPQAYREGGPLTAFATAAGFLVSFVLAGR